MVDIHIKYTIDIDKYIKQMREKKGLVEFSEVGDEEKALVTLKNTAQRNGNKTQTVKRKHTF